MIDILVVSYGASVTSTRHEMESSFIFLPKIMLKEFHLWHFIVLLLEQMEQRFVCFGDFSDGESYLVWLVECLRLSVVGAPSPGLKV